MQPFAGTDGRNSVAVGRKGEAVRHAGIRTDHLDGKETKGRKGAQGMDVMSLRKVTRKGQTRAGRQ